MPLRLAGPLMDCWVVFDLLGSSLGFGLASTVTSYYLFRLPLRSAIGLGILTAVVAYIQHLRQSPSDLLRGKGVS